MGGCPDNETSGPHLTGMGLNARIHAMSNMLTTEEAARIVGVSEKSMRRFRANGGGPPFIKLGYRTVRYSAESLRLWVASRESASGDAEKVA